MARINLLPWREQLREERKQRFLVTLVGVLIVAGGIVFLADQYLNATITQQNARNDFIRNEISALDS
ncbi:MAG: pilus assembly protein PilN, partial [Thiopseudomonas sp.]|nr:pilus assembly protein PilN [Thiopseudomonas sp.]